MKLTADYYLRDNVLAIAKDLIGKVLFTKIDDKLTSGIITETEAYDGFTDRASHAFTGKRTPRNENMYSSGGTAYVYFCYGIHSLFNVVTNEKDIPHAVLIRGVKPMDGIETMLYRRGKTREEKSLTIGPGSVSKALGIHVTHNGINLLGNRIWIEDRGIKIPKTLIVATPRIGVESAGEAALYPYRFVVNNKLI